MDDTSCVCVCVLVLLQLGQTPLHLAVINRRIIVSRVLLEEGQVNPDIADDEGKTPLMLASHEGQTDLVQLMLNHNADTQLKDTKGASLNLHTTHISWLL